MLSTLEYFINQNNAESLKKLNYIIDYI